MKQLKKNLLFLAAAVLLVGVSTASAQVPVFNLGTASPFVANTGRAEVVGQVTLTADVVCGTGADGLCLTSTGTVQILYTGQGATPGDPSGGMSIDNGLATTGIGTLLTNGIEVCEIIAGVTTCNAGGTYLVAGTFTVTNTGAGGVVSFGVVTGEMPGHG